MASFVGIDLTGDKELRRALDMVGERAEKRATKKAVRAGYMPVKQAIKARVPVGRTGNLRKSIGKKEKVYTGTFLVIAGPRIKMGEASGHHGHLIEFGTKPGYTGIGPALHPFERAYDATKDDALTKIMTRLRDEVLIEAEKAGRGS